MFKVFTNLAILFIIIFLSYYPEFDTVSVPSELFGQYLFQITFVSFCLGVYHCLRSKFLLGSFFFIIGFVNILILSSAFFTNDSIKSQDLVSSSSFRIFSYNMYIENKKYEETFFAIRRANPDIVLLLEVQRDFSRKYNNELLKVYPFKFPKTNEDKPYSWVLYSKFPILNNDEDIFKRIPNTNQRVLHADILYKETVINLLGIHALSPKSEDRIAFRNSYLQVLESYILGGLKDKPLILAGDMNSAPWRPFLRTFINNVQLENKDTLFSPTPSWPTWLPFVLQVPIDHILFSKNFCMKSKGRILVSGSDHFAIYADLVLCR